jgi:hypothetical protein
MPAPTSSTHRWVEDIRGPILFLAAEALPSWRGVEPGEDWPGEVVVPGVLGVVEVESGIGLMLHDDYAGAYTAWAPLPGGGGVLVGDVAYQGDAAVDAVANVPASSWQRIARTFRAGAGGAALFDGAWPGVEHTETGHGVELAAGDYHVDAVPRFEAGPVVARYVRLTPVNAAAEGRSA